MKIYPAALIFWDWHCLPGRPKMSIDATVMHGHRCTCFEIDGKQHFNAKGCERKTEDVQKDEIMTISGYGLMRLHYKDIDDWEQYIRYHMSRPVSRIQCTPSYRDYMVGDPYEPIVLSADDVVESAR